MLMHVVSSASGARHVKNRVDVKKLCATKADDDTERQLRVAHTRAHAIIFIISMCQSCLLIAGRRHIFDIFASGLSSRTAIPARLTKALKARQAQAVTPDSDVTVATSGQNAGVTTVNLMSP